MNATKMDRTIPWILAAGVTLGALAFAAAGRADDEGKGRKGKPPKEGPAKARPAKGKAETHPPRPMGPENRGRGEEKGLGDDQRRLKEAVERGDLSPEEARARFRELQEKRHAKMKERLDQMPPERRAEVEKRIEKRKEVREERRERFFEGHPFAKEIHELRCCVERGECTREEAKERFRGMIRDLPPDMRKECMAKMRRWREERREPRQERRENWRDHREDRRDRHEDIRDRRDGDNGWRDCREDRWDRREDIRDRHEDRRDRREDRREDRHEQRDDWREERRAGGEGRGERAEGPDHVRPHHRGRGRR